jgi:hypothetical protein
LKEMPPDQVGGRTALLAPTPPDVWVSAGAFASAEPPAGREARSRWGGEGQQDSYGRTVFGWRMAGG